MTRYLRLALTVGLPVLLPTGVLAAPATAAPPGVLWGLPFAGILLSIALLPVLAPHVWHRYTPHIVAFWVAALLLPWLASFGGESAAALIAHAAIAEYIPFIVLLGALYAIAGGIALRGNLHGSPATNTALLAVGTLLASVVGTTGASMLLIRPVLRANDDRVHKAHVVIFFIFLVSNIGGSLTPLGDPPLFLGFLKGVDFFWPTRHMAAPTLVLATLLLTGFFLLDRWIYRREGCVRPDPTPDSPLRIDGWRNVALLGGVIAVILGSSALPQSSVFRVLGTDVGGAALMRDGALLAIAALSLRVTPPSYRAANRFGWGPMIEVAVLFAGIFVTIAPVLAMLQAGSRGPLAPLLALLTRADGAANPAAYFWLTGLLTSFLDNAPTYLVFFNAAGGDAATLMGPLAHILLAISMGAVFMGANTYIGNAPNFMVRSIAHESGVKMPSFFGYMGWSIACLLPLFALVAWLFL